MIFRQLFDPATWTYTYLLADELSKEAILIDPVAEQLERDSQLIEELGGLTLKYAIDTHVHADHVTASGRLRELLGAATATAKAGGAPCADLQLEDGDHLSFGPHRLAVLATPGHTPGCVSYLLAEDDTHRVFTGDALLIRGSGRTDFQGGDPRLLYQSVYTKLFSLPRETQVYPGHDYRGRTSSTIAEELQFNPRLKAGTSQEQFVKIMRELKLPDPKHLEVAVPANQQCGRVAS